MTAVEIGHQSAITRAVAEGKWNDIKILATDVAPQSNSIVISCAYDTQLFIVSSSPMVVSR